jgi:hypothetical protein
MIFEAISAIADDLNAFFNNKYKTTEDLVVVSGIINNDGTVAIQGGNRIVITLINIEKESNVAGIGYSPAVTTDLSVNTDVLILFSAYFANNNYQESLRYISLVIDYFRSKSVFNIENTPKLDSSINKLVLRW